MPRAWSTEDPPARRDRWTELDDMLCVLSRSLESSMYVFLERLAEAEDGAIWGRSSIPGGPYRDFADYCETRLGLSYRTVARRLAVLRSLWALPAAERAPATTALAQIGWAKASVLAPVLRELPATWREALAGAEEVGVEVLQERVSKALGLHPRGATAPGWRWYRALLSGLPEETRGEVEAVFAVGFRLAETENPIQVFLSMIREVSVEWRQKR